MTEDDPKLTTAQFAERIGIARQTLNAYVWRGQAPKPDGHYDLRTPWWYQSTVDEWIAKRPGRGGPGRTRKPHVEPDA